MSPAELSRLLGQRLAETEGGHTALLAVLLSPTDRQLSIADDDAARRLLAEVARRVQEMLRSGDRYAFASREELWIMLVDLPSESLAELAGGTLLERLRRPIGAPRPDDPASFVHLQPAIGGAWAAAGGGIDARTMLSAASEATSTRNGHGRIELRLVQGSREGEPLRHGLERDLARALDANELEVYFQPQLELRTGQCRSAEALIRWRHPDGYPVDPEAIVAICEQHGLIGQLTRFTLNTALRHTGTWDAAGVEIAVAVNLSATTLSDPSLPRMVSQALETWDVAPSRLTLELTESALIHNQQVARESMKQLHRLGCRLSIDDFGTGYSPYTYLRQFSFDELKIDRAFVQRMNSDRADLRIVQSLVDLAHTFAMQTVAEGVEDERAERALRDLGCDLVQGWHVSAALAPGDFLAWCVARRANASRGSGRVAVPGG